MHLVLLIMQYNQCLFFRAITVSMQHLILILFHQWRCRSCHQNDDLMESPVHSFTGW